MAPQSNVRSPCFGHDLSSGMIHWLIPEGEKINAKTSYLSVLCGIYTHYFGRKILNVKIFKCYNLQLCLDALDCSAVCHTPLSVVKVFRHKWPMIPAARESPSTLIIVRNRSLWKEKVTDNTKHSRPECMHIRTFIILTVFCIKNITQWRILL